MKLKRSWFCKCGWTWDEEVGVYFNAEGDSGSSIRFCNGCHSKTEMEWRVIENTDPDDELEEASAFCFYCEQLLEPCEVNSEYENYAYPVCKDCSNFKADMEAQDIDMGDAKI